MLNCQARSITEMYPSIPLYPLLCKTNLILASTLLDFLLRLYTYKLLSLPDQHPIKDILPVNLKVNNASSQLRELHNNTPI